MSGISLSDFRTMSLPEQDWFIFRLIREQQDQDQSTADPSTSIDSRLLMKRTF